MQKQKEAICPPTAKKIPKKLVKHHHVRIDNYYWLNERENPEVLDYLKAENEYAEKVFHQPTKTLQKTIYREIIGRIPQKERTVPYFYNGYWYYTRYEKGKEYPIYCRKKEKKSAPEEIMLDLNILAKGFAYFDINNWEVSQDNKILAYSVDTVSRRQYTLCFKNLETGETLPEKIQNTSGDIAWAYDSKTVFYAHKNKALRPDKIFRHILGENPANDKLVFHERDAAFETGVYLCKSGDYIIIASDSTLSTEYRIVSARKPFNRFRIFTPRKKNMEYEIARQGNRFLIRTNDQAKNFRLMETPLENTERKYWKEVIPHREDVFIEEVEVFENFFVVAERKNGLLQFHIFNTQKQTDHYLPVNEPDYFIYFDDNYTYRSSLLRYGLTSLKTPHTLFDKI